MREGSYPADYCHFILANTVFIYSDYLKSVRYNPPVHGHSDLYNQYIEVRNILSFRDWLAHSAAEFIAHTEKRNSERALSTIDLAKQYIEQHLSGDLSLEAVSAQVFISPKYLSRLFKEELGITYTDYVTGRRMEQAKTLIESSKMTIEQIAGTVGYGTAAYFIKKFKEMYGCTPGNYLRSTAKQV
ncbi:Arabinose operon regulatory protein [compost metagenome]